MIAGFIRRSGILLGTEICVKMARFDNKIFALYFQRYFFGGFHHALKKPKKSSFISNSVRFFFCFFCFIHSFSCWWPLFFLYQFTYTQQEPPKKNESNSLMMVITKKTKIKSKRPSIDLPKQRNGWVHPPI